MSGNYEEVCGWTINASGLKSRDDVAGNPIAQAQVDTALLWLRSRVRKNKTRWYWGSSYGLKHKAERWGKANGLESYVSNGAMIKALVLDGFELRPLWFNSLNVRVKLSVRP